MMLRFLKGSTALTGPLSPHLQVLMQFGRCPFPANIQIDEALAAKLGLAKQAEEGTNGTV